MALEAPLRSSTGNLPFSFPHQSDMSAFTDPDSQGLSPYRQISSPTPSTDSALLRPNSVNRISSNANTMSPSDIVGPSPVTSNGTETTEIEDDALDDIGQSPAGDPSTRQSELQMLSMNIPDNVREPLDEAVSVIHAPESFASWAGHNTSDQPNYQERRSKSPKDAKKVKDSDGKNLGDLNDHPPRPHLSTNVKPVRYSIESATPLAQDLHDILNESNRLRSSSASSLEKIDEQTEGEGEGDDEAGYRSSASQQEEISSLKTALLEIWTLCNTLSRMSSSHRTRVFNTSGTPDAHEKAWKACWKLCQKLYENQDEDTDSVNVSMNLDLCRDFCQALFDVRQRNDEPSDSVLRVSFELNNHLFSAQDSRILPEAFRERTLDFYITLCHRLMKQRVDLAEETDHLLQACWGLTEMLFSLRQNRRDGRPLDAELLSSAVQACWDLCEIFREGWTQVRPDRNTPRPNKTTFFSAQQGMDQSGRESRASNRSSYSKRERESAKSSKQEERTRKPLPVPETPVTEFEDTPTSPEAGSPTMPNIMVLGTSSDSGRNRGWSSNASDLSGYSQSSARTSSTATTKTTAEDPDITRAKVLVLRAAMNLGFDRDTITDPKLGATTLQKFVQNMPPGSFGNHNHQATLLQQYKNSVLTDALIPRKHMLPLHGKRVLANDMAKSVASLSKSSARFLYLRELFRVVFGFSIDEVENRRNVSIVV